MTKRGRVPLFSSVDGGVTSPATMTRNDEGNSLTHTTDFWFANRKFHPPFRAAEFWVTDSRGRSIADASSVELAKSLANLLNDAVESEHEEVTQVLAK
jgi:hypothetical protein